MKWIAWLLLLGSNLYAAEAVHSLPSFDFTEAELQTLQMGQAVYRPSPDHHLGGIGMIVIEDSPAAIWRVITDYAHYPEFMPRCLKTEILATSENQTKLHSEYQGGLIMNVIWNDSVLTHQTQDPQNLKMAWKAYRTNLEMNMGNWELRSWGNHTLVYYKSEFEIGWVPKILASSSAEETIVATVTAVKRRTNKNRKPNPVLVSRP